MGKGGSPPLKVGEGAFWGGMWLVRTLGEDPQHPLKLGEVSLSCRHHQCSVEKLSIEFLNLRECVYVALTPSLD